MDDLVEPVERINLIEYQKIDHLTKKQMSDYWQSEVADPYINNDVDVYALSYHSKDQDNNDIELSGAVLVPKTDKIKGVISIQHATFFDDKEAPSENAPFSVVSRKSIFSSDGFIIILPDYQGYGIDKDRIHPYHQSSTLAIASYDMIEASRELMTELGFTLDLDVFLAGYSEGAYATAALQQLAEEESGLTIRASSLGSGSYDIRRTFESFLDQTDVPDSCTPCNAFFIQSYSSFYNMQEPLSYYFQEPYATEIENGLFLGKYDATFINSKLTSDPSKLFNPAFLNDYSDGKEIWKDALNQNSINNWLIKTPTLITHNINDNVSPYFNSEQLAELNQNNENVRFEPISQTNHFDGIFVWGIMTLEYFNQFD